MPIGQRHIAGKASAAAVQCQHARCDHRAITGRRPRLDLPGHRLARVKVEGVEIEDAHMRLVARVCHRCRGVVDLDITVVAGYGGRGFGATHSWRRDGTRPRERQRQCRSHQCRTDGGGEPRRPGDGGHEETLGAGESWGHKRNARSPPTVTPACWASGGWPLRAARRTAHGTGHLRSPQVDSGIPQSSPENLSQAACFDTPSASPIRVQLMPRPRRTATWSCTAASAWETAA